MKKGISIWIIVILMISLTACKGDENTKLSKRYKDLKSYTAQVTVTVTGNKGAAVYRLSQSYRTPDEYRVEVLEPARMDGTVSVIRGQEMWLRSAGTPAMRLEQGNLEEQTDTLFLAEFLKAYFDRETVPVLSPNQEGIMVLTAPERGNSRYRFTQELWIDATSNLPKRLITYDEDGNEMVRVEYDTFVPDAEIEDSVFLP